jgi:hypothetical protein
MRSSIGLAIEPRGEVYDGRRMVVDAFSFEFGRSFGFMGRFFFVVLVVAVLGVEKDAFFGRGWVGDGAAVRGQIHGCCLVELMIADDSEMMWHGKGTVPHGTIPYLLYRMLQYCEIK